MEGKRLLHQWLVGVDGRFRGSEAEAQDAGVQQRVHRRAEEDGLLVPGGDAGGGQLLPRGCLQGSGGADGREAAGTRV